MSFQNPFARKPSIPSVLASPKFPAEWPYTPADFAVEDSTPDSNFYSFPRFVHHIDEPARAALTKRYAEVLLPEHRVLDLCSSWVSHYPPEWSSSRVGGRVVGVGMNEEELRGNAQLDEFVVKDLNAETVLPFGDGEFDVVTIVVSVDYLTRPRSLFAEIGRVLAPGGRAVISMSNRCFPSKAFRIWLRTSDAEHVFIVGSFFHYAVDAEGEGVFEKPEARDLGGGGGGDPM
ncbi:hypothetical protein TeGR_g7834, partial [Tetraparma gracilis]